MKRSRYWNCVVVLIFKFVCFMDAPSRTPGDHGCTKRQPVLGKDLNMLVHSFRSLDVNNLITSNHLTPLFRKMLNTASSSSSSFSSCFSSSSSSSSSSSYSRSFCFYFSNQFQKAAPMQDMKLKLKNWTRACDALLMMYSRVPPHAILTAFQSWERVFCYLYGLFVILLEYSFFDWLLLE